MLYAPLEPYNKDSKPQQYPYISTKSRIYILAILEGRALWEKNMQELSPHWNVYY